MYLTCSVPYLKRLNKLDSDILYPGQVLKVNRQVDSTLNKDIEEDTSLTEEAKPTRINYSAIRNTSREISNLKALQDYLMSKCSFKFR